MNKVKAKYRLLNKWGNRVIYTDSEVEKNILINRGFHIDEDWQKPSEKKTTAPKKREKGNGKGKSGEESPTDV